MVVPSHDYDDVTAALRERGVAATEMGGSIIVETPETWNLCELSAVEVGVLRESRELVESLYGPPNSARARELSDLCEAIQERWCAALAAKGITAEPFTGLGVLFGNELLHGSILLSDPDQLRVTFNGGS